MFVRDEGFGIGAGRPVPAAAWCVPLCRARGAAPTVACRLGMGDVKDNPSNANDELVAAIYAAAAELVPPSRPLELLAELTRSDKVFSAHFDADQGRGGILASFNVEPNFIESYNEIYASQNPWLARASYFQAEGLVWRSVEILDNARLRETEFYKLFCYGQGIGTTAHLVVRVRGPDIFHAMLTRRGTNAEEYDDAALAICRLYAHHARRAMDISQAAANWRFMEEGFSAAADEIATGVAIVQAPATVLHMNRTFSALLAGARAAPVPPVRPAAFSRTIGRRPIEARLPRPLLEALAASPVPTSCLVHPEGEDSGRPVPVLIRPIRLRAGSGGASPSGFVLLCRSSTSEIELDEGALRSAYALTAAEARVCGALVGGENVHVLSAHLGISPQTARTHLKRIYDKTETMRQPELLRLLLAFSHRKTPKPAPARPGLAASEILPRQAPKGLFQSD